MGDLPLDDPMTLRDIEQIKQLKARYFRLLDTKRWDEWEALFTDDCTFRWGEGEHEEVRGREAIAATVPPMLADAVTVHHGHTPEIQLTSSNAATGVWAMADDVQFAGLRMFGAGHYHETYERGPDGAWRIASLELVRLRRDVEHDASGSEVI